MGDLSGCPPVFNSFEDRLKTFNTWPSSAPVGRESLARAGFIYEGAEVKVRCFVCQVKYESWKFGDTAIRKHKELKPDCPFVQENTDILTDSSSMIIDPHIPMEIPLQIPLRNIFSQSMVSQVDHGRGSPSEAQNLPSDNAPEFHKVWRNYTSMNKESERTKTYTDWPIPYIRPEDMARAGFVYLKQGDRVQCAFCYGIVAEWEPNDNPFQDHFKHFPRCPFVRGAKCNNISIEDELRGFPATPLQPPQRSVDECGHGRSLNTQTFQPERSPEDYSHSGHNHSLQQLNVITHQPSKYPAYATREVRKESFNQWPPDIPQNVASLVDAGFYYTGTTDSVKCFQCGGGLKNWEATDVPWEEHARWFPDCQYVALNKGREYVELSKKNKPPSNELSNSESEQAEKSPETSENRFNISEGELDILMNQDITKTVLELGLDRDKVKKALEIRFRNAGYPFPDSESLANAALEVSDTPPPQIGNSMIEAGSSNSLSQVNNGDITEQNVAKVNSGGLQLATTREDDLRLCKVCMDREMNIVFLPCGHFVACVDCASVMDNCPVCRTKIKGNVKTYWP